MRLVGGTRRSKRFDDNPTDKTRLASKSGHPPQLVDHLFRRMTLPAHDLDPPDPGQKLTLRLVRKDACDFIAELCVGALLMTNVEGRLSGQIALAS